MGPTNSDAVCSRFNLTRPLDANRYVDHSSLDTEPRFIDLFAGLGRFHIALERIGGRCLFAAEWKDHPRDLYEENFGLRPAGDMWRQKPYLTTRS